MNDNFVRVCVIILIVVVIFVAYIILAVNELVNDMTHSSNRKRMFRALDSVLSSCYESEDSVDCCLAEIELIFKHIISNDELLKRYYSNAGVLLEKHLVQLNAGDAKKESQNIKDIIKYKRYVMRLINEYENKFPTDCISGANSVLLNQLVEYSNNNDKFIETVKQLAIEIKSLQDAVFEKDKGKRKQNIISVVGIVLSVVFGVMTFLQFFV